jgi:hypothetical protein
LAQKKTLCRICLNVFHLQKCTCPEAKFRRKKKNIQANSLIIFTCPNPVLLVLVRASGLVPRLLCKEIIIEICVANFEMTFFIDY